MKNIKIGIKLLGVFLPSALLVLMVGLLSINPQSELAQKSELLGSEGLPAMENILLIKSEAASTAALMLTLLTPRREGHRPPLFFYAKEGKTRNW